MLRSPCKVEDLSMAKFSAFLGSFGFFWVLFGSNLGLFGIQVSPSLCRNWYGRHVGSKIPEPPGQG